MVVADSVRTVMLGESSLPMRYYFPHSDVRTDLLEPSATRTWCAYKGEAAYHHVRTAGGLHEDIAWYYRFPALGLPQIADLVCFYAERVDSVLVDGVGPRT